MSLFPLQEASRDVPNAPRLSALVPYLRAIRASVGMSVDDVPTCRLHARLREGLEKAVVSSLDTSLLHNLQLSTSNCRTLRYLGHHGAVRSRNIALLNSPD